MSNDNNSNPFSVNIRNPAFFQFPENSEKEKNKAKPPIEQKAEHTTEAAQTAHILPEGGRTGRTVQSPHTKPNEGAKKELPTEKTVEMMKKSAESNKSRRKGTVDLQSKAKAEDISKSVRHNERLEKTEIDASFFRNTSPADYAREIFNDLTNEGNKFLNALEKRNPDLVAKFKEKYSELKQVNADSGIDKFRGLINEGSVSRSAAEMDKILPLPGTKARALFEEQHPNDMKDYIRVKMQSLMEEFALHGYGGEINDFIDANHKYTGEISNFLKSNAMDYAQFREEVRSALVSKKQDVPEQRLDRVERTVEQFLVNETEHSKIEFQRNLNSMESRIKILLTPSSSQWLIEDPIEAFNGIQERLDEDSGKLYEALKGKNPDLVAKFDGLGSKIALQSELLAVEKDIHSLFNPTPTIDHSEGTYYYDNPLKNFNPIREKLQADGGKLYEELKKKDPDLIARFDGLVKVITEAQKSGEI